MSANTSPARPAVSRRLPTTSSRAPACSSRDSGTCTDAIHTAAAAIGRLMTNTSRHDTESMSQPPRNGPRAVAMAARPDHAPMARPRSPGRNDADTMARLLGTTSAAATPCRQRAAISEPMSGAIAHTSDVTANATTPMREDLAAPVAVAQRAAEHEERAQREEVAREDPLEVGQVGVQVVGDGRQRGVDDGAIEERDPRAEHRGGDDPAALRGAHAEVEGSHASSEPRTWQNHSHAANARPDSEREGVGAPRRPSRRGRTGPPVHRPPPHPRGHVTAGFRRSAPRRAHRAAARSHRRHDGSQRADREHRPAGG